MKFNLKMKIVNLNSITNLSLSLISSLFIISCSKNLTQTYTQKDTGSKNKENLKEVWLMTYNVENLFDTKDDPKKNDETYLPTKLKRNNKAIIKKCKKAPKSYWVRECLETNWNEFKLDLKLKRLKKVISSFNNNKGADVLILQEVENIQVLRKLKDEYLNGLGYKSAVLIEGPDKRGIDVGIISKLALDKNFKPKLHLQDFNRSKPTRGIIEASFRLDSKSSLTVLGVHFPSQGTKTQYRKQAVKKLNSILKTIPKKNIIVAGGDFNITSSEEKKHRLFKKDLSSEWSVSHLVGCKNCKGSHYYHRKRSWSFLDALLFSKNLTDKKGWELDTNSIQVYSNSGIQNNRYGSPSKFNGGQHKTGVSDHWPVAARIYSK